MNAPPPTYLRPMDILLVEDNPDDILLTTRAFAQAKVQNRLQVVTDGMQAMKFLLREDEYAQAPRPDLVLLDVKLPAMDGLDVLTAIKCNHNLRSIPVAMMSDSASEQDVLRAYDHYANCYLPKPGNRKELVALVNQLEQFWFCSALLPPKTADEADEAD